LYYLVGRIVFLGRSINPLISRRKIICVGNIFAGGVGKTPVVRAIAQYFDAPIVMRGYKKNKNSGDCGDEANMLARSGLTVHVGDRKSNVVLLNNQNQEIGPIVMDDGLQNPTIKKDISIMVFDQGLGYGNGFLLPAGPLRQPKRAAKKADAIIVIKSNKPKKNFKLPKNVPVFYAQNQTVSPYDEDVKLVAFAGIGYPKKFFDALKNVVAKRSFPDHYQYISDDINKLIALADKKGAKLITTEKDWVRLPVEIRDEIKYARLDTVIDDAFWDWLKEKLK
jgi:tetraacyldisaccharide 4'-kinase